MGRRAATHSGKPSSRRLDSKSQQTAASELTTQYPANLMSGFTATEGDRKTDPERTRSRNERAVVPLLQKVSRRTRPEEFRAQVRQLRQLHD